MSAHDSNAQTLDRLLAAWNRGDVEATVEQFDPECEVVFRPQVPEPGPFHGRDELRAWVQGFHAAVGSSHAELVEIIAEKEDCLVVVLRLTGEGAGSGIGVELNWHNVFEFRGDTIVRWRDFDEREAALEAAGTSP